MEIFNDLQPECPPYWPKQLNSCRHHRNKYKFISLDECQTPNLIFKCNKCEKGPNEKMLNVSEFLYSTDNYVFDYLPDFSKELSQKIIYFINRKERNLMKEVKHFFEELQYNVIEVIQDIEKEMMKKAIQVDSFQDKLRKQYTKLIRKQEIKQIIENDSSVVEKSNDIKKEILNILSNSENNRKLLEQQIKQINEYTELANEINLLDNVSSQLFNKFQDFGDVISNKLLRTLTNNHSQYLLGSSQ